MDHVIDMTQGNARKLILRFFFPMLITNMLQQLYSFADTMIVGRASGITHLRRWETWGRSRF